MKTMKKILALAIATLFAVSQSAFSQHTKDVQVKSEDGKMHIKVEIEKDGKVTKVDTTINLQELDALHEHLKDLDIHIGTLDDHAGDINAHAFRFDGDEKELAEHMKQLKEHLKDSKLLNLGDNTLLNMEEFEKLMKEMEGKIKNTCHMYKLKIEGDSATEKELMELEKELEDLNMNFNFNDDGTSKTIIIGNHDNDKGDNKAEKKVIIKKTGNADGKGIKQKNENKKVIMIMRTSAPEKQKAEFAAEPVNQKENQGGENAARVRVVEKEKKPGNPWLTNLTCYPNPSTGEFTISFQLSNPQAAELKIMDIAGREVFAENIPENTEWVERQITLPSKSSAAYLLILRQGSNWHHEKIFVKS